MKGPARGAEVEALMAEGASEGLAVFAADLLAAAAAEAPPSPPPGRDPDPNVTLRTSGRVEVERHAGRLGVVVSFNTPYAAKLHEDVRAKHPDGGKAKYLEDPLKEAIPKLEGIVGGEVRKRMSSARRA